jgi:hypothetical protein
MLRPIVVLLIVLGIVACPLICRVGWLCGNDRATTTQVCCNRCHSDSAESDTQPNAPGTPAPEGGCQCICGGAVVSDDSQPDLRIGVTDWIILPDAHTNSDQLLDSPEAGVYRVPFPQGGDNPGRALRCLMLSFLC